MKTISKIELALAASVMPFVAMSEPTDEDLTLIETMLELGDTPEEVCMSFDNIEGLRHVRIPASKVYEGVDVRASEHMGKVVELYPTGKVVAMPMRG